MAFYLIVLASLSDLFDGYLARKRNEKTILGACLDPIADKFFILSCYFAFALGYSPNFVIPSWFAWLVFIKETILIIGAILIYKLHGHFEIRPLALGKLAMDAQVFFIIWIFVSHFFNYYSFEFFNLLLSLVVIFVLSSLFQYATIGIKQLLLSNCTHK